MTQYNGLDENGLPEINAQLPIGDCIIGKVMNPIFRDNRLSNRDNRVVCINGRWISLNNGSYLSQNLTQLARTVGDMEGSRRAIKGVVSSTPVIRRHKEIAREMKPYHRRVKEI